jgi:hypothetical protein
MKTRLAALSVLCLILTAVPSAAQVAYNNGPINGNDYAYTINFGLITADTFTISTGNTTMTGLSFGAWLYAGDILETAEVSMTSEPFSGTTYFDQDVSFTQSGCAMNQYGLNVCTEAGTFNGPTLANGTYWLNLQNAVVSSGDPVYWDTNNGVGCTSPGCPSLATCNSCLLKPQYQPSESFTLYGSSSGATVPEPGSILLFGSGVLTLVGLVRRKRM